MPPGARSRGCEGCQRRKIKCDEKTPICGKCEKLGLLCSGPKEGPIILAYNPEEKLRKKQRNALTATPLGVVGTDDSSDRQSLTPYYSPSIRAIPDDLAKREWFALKLQECVFIPHQQHNSLVPELAKLTVSNEYPILQRAVWSTSAALGGIASGNLDLLKRAQETYTSALKLMMRGLSKPKNKDTKQWATTISRQVTVEMVGAAALFVWYEALVPTNPNGWIAHAFGTGRLVLVRDPKDYRLGLSHSIFRTSRYMMANASILTVEPTPFGTPPWLKDPFVINPKKGFDRITDFLLTIPLHLAWVNEKIITGLPIPRSVEAARVMEEVHVLEQGLTNFLLGYKQEMMVAGKPDLFHDISHDSIDSTGQYQPKIRQYFADDIAECVTHYEICRLLIALIKAAFSSADEFVARREEARDHSASILSGVAFAEANTTTGMIREKFGLICVLITILVASPTKEHRDYATARIESWGGEISLRGASHYHPTVRWKALSTMWQEPALMLSNSELPQDSGLVFDTAIENDFETSLQL